LACARNIRIEHVRCDRYIQSATLRMVQLTPMLILQAKPRGSRVQRTECEVPGRPPAGPEWRQRAHRPGREDWHRRADRQRQDDPGPGSLPHGRGVCVWA
jgi:hypothetical protein